MARTKKNESEQIKIAERRARALELRKAGFSYRKIAEKLSVSHVQARADIEAELKLLAEELHESADELRQIELERLDMLTRGLEPFAAVGETKAVNSFIKVMERRAKLLGLDAPIRTDVTSGGEKLEVIIREVNSDHANG